MVWTTNPTDNKSSGEWVEVCFFTTATMCTNDGHGGSNGDPHLATDNCNGPYYTEYNQEFCTWSFVGGGSSEGSGGNQYDDGNYPDHPTGGGNNPHNDDCEDTSGTLISSGQPIDGINTGCTSNETIGIKQVNNDNDDDCNTSKEDLKKVFPNIPDNKAELLTKIINDKGQDFGITSDENLWHFLSQTGHETGGFNTLNVTEDLNYSVQNLLDNFSSRFSQTDTTKLDPDNYKYDAEKLSNYVYCCRMGNGNEASGDGWKYRGRGIKQLTGKYNYTRFKNWYNNKYNPNIDPVSSPNIISSNDTLAILSGLWYYKVRVVDKITIDSTTSVNKVTYAINGGYNGKQSRINYFNKIKDSINCK